ncbi:L,D-transpeptidase family protein [Pseudonocardia sp. 73-21]|uniref:L,D-transpeptidase n=1 Tax=Pseudonocardia sp. 73-21 TaxID=1895809 RepID=UPI000965FCF1|nr:L,D-transpeptidase family protein [Pseudonocardia sp. 73-21]OJY54397.1 MAG: hypothetical protein BGP03_22935 [Pseudonocardia sp. 73-21]
MGVHRRAGASRRWEVLGLCGVVAIGLLVMSGGAGVGAADVPEPGARPSQATMPAAGSTAAGTPCSAAARACVDLAGHTAWLIGDGQVVRGPVPFVDGAVDKPTPRGTYKVEWKAQRWTSREYGTEMPYSVFFAPGGIAFHEGRQDTPSAGCVKLVRDEAMAFFDYLQVGDRVEVR